MEALVIILLPLGGWAVHGFAEWRLNSTARSGIRDFNALKDWPTQLFVKALCVALLVLIIFLAVRH